MANSERQFRTPQSTVQTVAGVIAEKVNVEFLNASYGRLYAYKPKTPNGVSHPHPTNLTTKESLIRGISNWLVAHANLDESAECDNCKGRMDLGLVQNKVVPESCIYCGEGPITFDDEEPSAPAHEPPAEDEDDEETESIPPPAAAEAEESDVPPESGKVAAMTTKKTVKKVKAKKGSKKETAVKPDALAKSEVVDKDAKVILDGVERVRSGLTKGVQDVYSEMWAAGKWFAEVQKSKAWTKHPSAFSTWKAFIEGCFGVIVNVKRVDELVIFYQTNKEVPKLGGGIKLPGLPKIKNPQPKKKAAEPETSPAFDPKNISIAGVFAKRQRISLLTEKGKPAKTLKDRPIFFIKSDNGVIIKVAIGATPKGPLVALVTIDRE